MLRSVRAAAAVMLVASCSTYHQSTGARRVGTALRPFRAGYTTLRILNQNAEDVRVYIVRSGTLVSVGTVGSLSARSFSVSPAQTGSFGTLTLAIETFPSRRRHIAEMIDFEPGRGIDLRIDGQLAYTRVESRAYRRR